MLKIFKKKKDPKAQLKKVLGNFELPVFPIVVQQIMNKLRDPNVSNAVIAGLIAQDPGLSTSLLKTVNSAIFSPASRVDNLNQAVAMLGLAPLESLILSISVGQMLPTSSSLEHSVRKFWLASARRAAVARAIALKLHPVSVNLSYMAALLQDMAIPFLITQKKEYGNLLDTWNEEGGDLAEMEHNAFGWDHAEVATWICCEWCLPDSLMNAIGGHHGAEVEGFEVPPAVLLVNTIREDGNEAGVDQLIEKAKSLYGMKPDQVAELVQEGFEAAEELAGLFMSH